MSKLSFYEKYLSDIDLVEIEESVKQVETKTCAELVPVLVKSSVPDVFLYLFAILYSSLVLNVLLAMEQLGFSSLSFLFPYTYMVSAVVLGLYLVLTKVNSISYKYLLPSFVINYFTEIRMAMEFASLGLKNTELGSGVMLFISFKERRVHVVGDSLISQKLSGDIWDKSVALIIKATKKSQMAKGIIACIESMGVELEKHFPIRENDINELKDHIRIKE